MDKINNLSRSNNTTSFLTSVTSLTNTNLEDLELYELSCLSGIQMDVKVFKYLKSCKNKNKNKIKKLLF
jgi:hypothetical protein